jgi:hypothetical protein
LGATSAGAPSRQHKSDGDEDDEELAMIAIVYAVDETTNGHVQESDV